MRRATQLYSQEVRYPFELIQNADDAKYSIAAEEKATPMLSFAFSSTELVVESNEDGFRRKDVQAMCTIGESSKTADSEETTIGEKGLGFKSVFSIAKEVRIQSRLKDRHNDYARSTQYWSFRFKHEEHQDGTGLTTPLPWNPGSDLPGDIGTRITVVLTDKAREPERLAALVAEAENLDMSVLMFVNRVQKLSISVDRIFSPRTASIVKEAKQAYGPDSLCSIQRITRESSDRITNLSIQKEYFVWSQLWSKMPEEKLRTLKDHTMTQLAFPIARNYSHLEQHQPKISAEGESVFAFLPLQKCQNLKVGIHYYHLLRMQAADAHAHQQFLIHADFITLPNREGIQPASVWNEVLRSCVVEMFCSAVQAFSRDGHPLQFSWLQYLPQGDLPDFWNSMPTRIKAKLASPPLFWSRDKGGAKNVSQIAIVPNHFMHEQKPLFADLDKGLYLAEEYAPTDLPTLRYLGICTLSWDDMLDRIEADTAKGTRSQMQTKDPTDHWHSAFASSLLILLEQKSSSSAKSRNREIARNN